MTGLNDVANNPRNCSCGGQGGHLASCDIWPRARRKEPMTKFAPLTDRCLYICEPCGTIAIMRVGTLKCFDCDTPATLFVPSRKEPMSTEPTDSTPVRIASPQSRISPGDPRYCEPSATRRHATTDRWKNNVPANNSLVGVCFYCLQPVRRTHTRSWWHADMVAWAAWAVFVGLLGVMDARRTNSVRVTRNTSPHVIHIRY